MSRPGRRRLADQIKHEREMRRVTERANRRALKIQATEYERRLDALNHAHDQAVAEQARTLPRADFETYRDTTRRERELEKDAQDIAHDRIEETARGNARVVDRIVTQVGTVRGVLVFVGFAGFAALAIVVVQLLSGH